MRALLIGIDLGTSSVKTEIYDENGNLLRQGHVAINKQDHVLWIKAISSAIPRDYLANLHYNKLVSIDSTSGTILLVDKYGNPLYPPIMYYEKAPEYYERIKELDSVKELKKKGINVSATSPIVKILKIKNELPQIYEKTRWILPPTTWLLYKLVIPEGHEWKDIAIDYTNALKFGADITLPEPEWFKPLFEETGISLEKLPRITKCGEYIGEANSEFARKLGLYKSKVYQGMTDGNAAALASGALEPGELTIYSGSTTVPKYVATEMKLHPAFYYHKHPIKGYLASAATGLTGGMLSWFSEKIFNAKVDEALEKAKIVEPGTEFLFFPPGDRSPFYNPKMGAVLANIRPINKDRDTIIGLVTRSIVLGIILVEYSFIKLLENLFDNTIKEVNLSGGGSKDKYWNTIRASVYGKPVNVYGEHIAVGTLIPAILESQLYEDIKTVRKKFLHMIDRVKPDPRLTRSYKAIAETYFNKWKILNKIYEDL
ncbi:MAG: hypothetical protein J7J82_02790 [Staphylothermus sp.]|nr:hypothetical protein [Staphylothermus sp.]